MKKGFLKEILVLLFAYGVVHCFVALISNNPSPDYDMSVELNLYTIVSVYTYFTIAVVLNLIAFMYGMTLNKKKKILNYIGVNLANFVFYYGSYILLNIQMERIIDIEQIIIITRGLGYIAILSILTIVFLMCVTSSKKILETGRKIIRKNKEEIRKELLSNKKQSSKKD